MAPVQKSAVFSKRQVAPYTFHTFPYTLHTGAANHKGFALCRWLQLARLYFVGALNDVVGALCGSCAEIGGVLEAPGGSAAVDAVGL